MVGRSEQTGSFEQEASEGTEMESILCFLRYLLLNFAAATFRADVAFFSCIPRLSRLHSRHSGMAGRHYEPGDFRVMNLGLPNPY